MKRYVFRIASVMMIALAGVFATGCAPMVYDNNPHFSHHRVPQKPAPKPLPAGRPVNGRPTPGKPNQGPNNPGPNNPGNNTPNRPGMNNHR